MKPNLKKLTEEGFVKIMEHDNHLVTYKKDNIQVLYDRYEDKEIHRYDMRRPFG